MSQTAVTGRAGVLRLERREARLHRRSSGAHPRREALPRTLAPMLAILGTMPLDAASWRFEQKWDGYRAVARWDGARCVLLSRNGLDLTARFPELHGIFARRRTPLLLDGEIVALDRMRRASFGALQARLRTRGSPTAGAAWSDQSYEVNFMVFDLLHHAGLSTREMDYLQRRELLEELELEGSHWSTPPFHRDGAGLLERMDHQGAEGIMAKRAGSLYQPGKRSDDWVKIKLQQSDDFVVVGWWSKDRQLSSLLLAYHSSEPSARSQSPMHYAGKVGTGFSEEDRVALQTVLERDEQATPPCAGLLPRGAGLHWSRPRLVAQIRFTEWTRDGRLRHPAFLGLRHDSEPRTVVHTEKGRQ